MSFSSTCADHGLEACCQSRGSAHSNAFGGSSCCQPGNKAFEPVRAFSAGGAVGSFLVPVNGAASSTSLTEWRVDGNASVSGSIWTGEFVSGCPYGLAYCSTPDSFGKTCLPQDGDPLGGWRCVFDGSGVGKNAAASSTSSTTQIDTALGVARTSTHTTFTRNTDTACAASKSMVSPAFDLTTKNSSIWRQCGESGRNCTKSQGDACDDVCVPGELVKNKDWRPSDGPASFSVLKGRHKPVDGVSAACACTEYGLLPPRTPNWPMIQSEAMNGQPSNVDMCEIATGAKRCSLDFPCFGDSPGPVFVASTGLDTKERDGSGEFGAFIGAIDEGLQFMSPGGGASTDRGSTPGALSQMEIAIDQKWTSSTALNCYDTGSCSATSPDIIQNRISWSYRADDGVHTPELDPDDAEYKRGTFFKIDRDSGCKCKDFSCDVDGGGSKIKANLYWFLDEDVVYVRSENKYLTSTKLEFPGCAPALNAFNPFIVGDSNLCKMSYIWPPQNLKGFIAGAQSTNIDGDLKRQLSGISTGTRTKSSYTYRNFCGENKSRNACGYRGRVKASCSNFKDDACRECGPGSSAASVEFRRGISAQARCPKNGGCGQREVSVELKPGDVCEWRSASVITPLSGDSVAAQTDLAANPFLRVWSTQPAHKVRESLRHSDSIDYGDVWVRAPGHAAVSTSAIGGTGFVTSPLEYTNPWTKGVYAGSLEYCGERESFDPYDNETQGSGTDEFYFGLPGFPFSRRDVKAEQLLDTGKYPDGMFSGRFRGPDGRLAPLPSTDKPVHQFIEGTVTCGEGSFEGLTGVASCYSGDAAGGGGSCADYYQKPSESSLGVMCESRPVCPAGETIDCAFIQAGSCGSFFQRVAIPGSASGDDGGTGTVAVTCAEVPGATVDGKACYAPIESNACDAGGDVASCKPDAQSTCKDSDAAFPTCKHRYTAYYAPRFMNYPQRTGELDIDNVQDAPHDTARICAMAEASDGSVRVCIEENGAVLVGGDMSRGSLRVATHSLPATMFDQDSARGQDRKDMEREGYGFNRGEMFGTRITEYLPYALCTDVRVKDGGDERDPDAYECAPGSSTYESWSHLYNTDPERAADILFIVKAKADALVSTYQNNEELNHGALISATGPETNASESLVRWGMYRDTSPANTLLVADGGEKLVQVGDYLYNGAFPRDQGASAVADGSNDDTDDPYVEGYAGHASTNYTNVFRCQLDLDRMLGLGKRLCADDDDTSTCRWVPDAQLSSDDEGARVRLRQAAIMGYNNTTNGPENWGLSELDMLQIFHSMRLDLSFANADPDGTNQYPCHFTSIDSATPSLGSIGNDPDSRTKNSPLRDLCRVNASVSGDDAADVTDYKYKGADAFNSMGIETTGGGGGTISYKERNLCSRGTDSFRDASCCSGAALAVSNIESDIVPRNLLQAYDGSAGPAVNMCANAVAPYYMDLLTLRANYETFSGLMWYWAANIVRGVGVVETNSGALQPYSTSQLCSNIDEDDPLSGYLGCSTGAMKTSNVADDGSSVRRPIVKVQGAGDLFVWWWATLPEERKAAWIGDQVCHYNPTYGDEKSTTDAEYSCDSVDQVSGKFPKVFSKREDLRVGDNAYLRECSCVNRHYSEKFCAAKTLFGQANVPDTCWHSACEIESVAEYNCPPGGSFSGLDNWKLSGNDMKVCNVQNYCVQNVVIKDLVANDIIIEDISQCMCCLRGFDGDFVTQSVSVQGEDDDSQASRCNCVTPKEIAESDTTKCLLQSVDLSGFNCGDFQTYASSLDEGVATSTSTNGVENTNCVSCHTILQDDAPLCFNVLNPKSLLRQCRMLTNIEIQTASEDVKKIFEGWIFPDDHTEFDAGGITQLDQFKLQCNLCFDTLTTPAPNKGTLHTGDCTDPSMWPGDDRPVIKDGVTLYRSNDGSEYSCSIVDGSVTRVV
jgi:hypothetical protein